MTPSDLKITINEHLSADGTCIVSGHVNVEQFLKINIMYKYLFFELFTNNDL